MLVKGVISKLITPFTVFIICIDKFNNIINKSKHRIKSIYFR